MYTKQKTLRIKIYCTLPSQVQYNMPYHTIIQYKEQQLK